MNTPSKFIALLIALLANFTMPAAARTPQGSDITGTIQKVDMQAQEIELLRNGNGTVFKVIWNKLATFVANGHLTDASMLKTGAHVDVTYRAPFVGKPFATRVTLIVKPASK